MTRGSGVRFERIELRYGRHATAFDLTPASGASSNGGQREPFVILGPNGSGKSTLVEAILRTLFGFHRLRALDRETHDLRRPWRGGGYRGRLRVGTPDGTYTFERDFDTDEVRVTRSGRESPVFEEEANPARGGESMVRYHALLERIVGLTELDAYLRTACVFQGALLDTDLGVGLLRVAAGGHADMETAHERLKEEYRRLSVAPIADDASRRRKAGELEIAEEEVDDLEARLREARAVEGRRLPLVRSRDELRSRLEGLEDEIERLSDAFEVLSEAERLDLEVESSRGRIRALESAAVDLDEALARLDLLVDRGEERGPRYPEDFETRARLLEEELWPALADIDRERARLEMEGAGTPSFVRHPAAFWASGVGAIIGVALGLGGVPIGYALAGLGVLGMAGWWVTARAARARAAERERRIEELAGQAERKRARIEGLREGVPDGAALGPENLAAHRREFRRERSELELETDADRRLRQTMDAASRALEAVAESGEDEAGEVGGAAGGAGATGDVRTRARALLRRLRERVARERDDVMAPLKLRLGELARSRFELPAEVDRDPSLETVRRARRERLERHETVRGELGEVERQLAVEARQGESALSIARELEATRARADALAARAEAYRRAHALITDAYEAFRRTDEERLVAAITEHLIGLSGGRLGPLEVEDGLESAAVRVGERVLGLGSPPLSYGQLHAALLAVRLGAADFLAGLGVRIPLLIDDPFVHLDEHSAADLWRVLGRVARERQVIISTQDRLLLSHLGVAADLELVGGRRALADRRPPPADGRPGTGEGEPLDLWSQTDA